MSSSFELPQIQLQEVGREVSRPHAVMATIKQFVGRAALVVGLAAGPGIAAGAAETVLEPRPALAAAEDFVNDYPDMDAADCSAVYGPDSWCKGGGWLSSRNFGYRNCVDGVAYWVKKYTGVTLSSNLGNAKTWDDRAPANALVYPGNTNNIEPGDIAQSDDGDMGHVGFVTSVTKDTNGNVVSFTTAELNKRNDGGYTGPDKNIYAARNAAGKFSRGVDAAGKSLEWDHFIDVNGAGKGLHNEAVNPAPDTDRDGVIDSQDDCPNKTGVANYYGCPAYDPPIYRPTVTAETTNGTAISSWGNGRLDGFRRNDDGTVSHKVFDNGQWSAWLNELGGDIVGKPAAVSWGWGRIDVFGVGADGKLKHTFIDNNTGPWRPWETLDQFPGDPGCLKNGVNASTWGWGRLDVVTTGCDNTARHLWLNNNQWQAWDNLGGCIKGVPAATSWGPNRLDVFVTHCDDAANDHALYTKVAGQNGWSDWVGMGGCLSSGPGVTSVGPQRLDVFARGCAYDELLHKPFRINANGAGQWLGWQEWGGNIAQAPSAVNWGPGRMDIISTGPDGTTQHFWLDRNWPASGWEGL